MYIFYYNTICIITFIFSGNSTASESETSSKTQASLVHINDTNDTEYQIAYVEQETYEAKVRRLNLKNVLKISTPEELAKNKLYMTELTLYQYTMELRKSLRINHIDHKGALDVLDKMNDLQINFLMLVKHKEIVNTIYNVAKYGKPVNWDLSKQEIIEHIESRTLIRYKAQNLFKKFKSLFTISDGETFTDVYKNERKAFFTQYKFIPTKQLNCITLDKYQKMFY